MRLTVRFTGLVVAALIAGTGPASAGIVADSVADFSGVQGLGGWQYGYFNVTLDADQEYAQSEFTQLPEGSWSGSVWEWPGGSMPPWVSFNPWASHPDGTNRPEEHHAIRRWVSDVSGEVLISGVLAKWDTRSGNGASNGTIGTLVFDGTELIHQTLAWNDNSGISYSFPITVHEGSIIDLCVDANGTDYFDGTMFTMTVTQVPAPATLTAAAFLVGLTGRRRRR